MHSELVFMKVVMFRLMPKYTSITCWMKFFHWIASVLVKKSVEPLWLCFWSLSGFIHLRVYASANIAWCNYCSYYFLNFFIYLWETQREREAETQAEAEAGSTKGAQHGTRSWVSRITPWAEGSTKPPSHPGLPFHFLIRISLMGQTKWHHLKPRVWSCRPGIESCVGLPAGSLLLPLPVSLPLFALSEWINK